jgi:hypothetical protein
MRDDAHLEFVEKFAKYTSKKVRGLNRILLERKVKKHFPNSLSVIFSWRTFSFFFSSLESAIQFKACEIPIII